MITLWLATGVISKFSSAPVPPVPSGAMGGGGTVARAPDPIRPNRRAQVRNMLADQLDRAQRPDEPELEPEPPRKKRVKTVAPILGVTTDTTLGIIREIEAKVQASIDAAALAQAEALALELAFMAEDEADLEMILLAGV